MIRTSSRGRRLLAAACRATWAAVARGAEAGRAVAGWSVYHRREAVAVALLATSLLGGLAVERWRAASPDVAARLEIEPARPRPPPRPPGPRRRQPVAPEHKGAARAEGDIRPSRDGQPTGIPAPGAGPPERLDLNRATAAELEALPGIGPRLAARIVAQREGLGGRFASAADLAAVPGVGRRRAEALAPLVAVSGDGTAPGEPPTGSPGDRPAGAAAGDGQAMDAPGDRDPSPDAGPPDPVAVEPPS